MVAARPFFSGSPGRSYLTWPRISPPGLAAVCRLTYQRPLLTCSTCAAVSAIKPVIGLASGPANGTTTPALAPGMDGPWKWPAVTGAVTPEYVNVHLRTLPSSSTRAVPVPVLVFGGTSFLADSGTVMALFIE